MNLVSSWCHFFLSSLRIILRRLILCSTYLLQTGFYYFYWMCYPVFHYTATNFNNSQVLQFIDATCVCFFVGCIKRGLHDKARRYCESTSWMRFYRINFSLENMPFFIKIKFDKIELNYNILNWPKKLTPKKLSSLTLWGLWCS